MDLLETFLTAMDSLMANKLRAILTMLGVIIGVAAVIALMAIGNGFSQFIEGEIQSIGANLIFVLTDADNSRGYPALSVRDVEALSAPGTAPSLAAVSASTQGTKEIIAGGNSERTSVLGVTANYFEVNNLTELDSGGLLTALDDDTQARVVVLGHNIAEDLFEGAYVVGQSVRIDGTSYEVVGVLSEQGGSGGLSSDSNVYLPLSTAQQRLYTGRTRNGLPSVSNITVQAVSDSSVDQAKEEITTILRDEHNIYYESEDDFEILSQADLVDFSSTITGTLTLFLGAIAGISLIVGGIGIMNIMLVSVTERTREIGIRKAVGALRRNILSQFLIESLLLSLLGGVIGIVLGSTTATLVGRAIDLTAVVDVSTVLMATGFAAAVGLVFGIYPAWRAASLRPIEALRYE